MDHVVAIVQARLGSERLPRKVLADLGGEPIIAHVMKRAAAIPGVHTAIAAIPDSDGELEAVLRALKIPVFLGSATDVLDRYVRAAAATSADVIVRVTGDCPLLCPELAGQVLGNCLNVRSGGFYSAYVTADGGIDGLDVEVMRRWMLETANANATEPADREHVTTWIRRNCLRMQAPPPIQFPFKVSVDTPEDLAAVRAIYKQLPPGHWSFNDLLVAAARAGVWDFK
ncbi:MAG TPA: hypothetical protein VEU08_17295 [Vicinamibacterales bacterium]|nr:hypothetical protein [Vicinamibacterales bacterium]